MGKNDNSLIFVVDDDPLFTKAVKHALESKKFVNVKLFSSGEDALEQLTLKPQIMLLDMRLGPDRMDGIEVLKVCQKRSPDTRVVFLTAVDNLEVATETMKNGAYDYVVKSETAFERVKNLLRRIVFENQIKKENLLLRQSRKVILSVVLLLIITILILVIVNLS